jgi:DNA primase
MERQDLVQQIKDAPISRIIGHYIPLVHKGHTLLGQCPFHNDKNPSLQVNDSKGLWHCFPCDTGGDAFTFVQKKRGLDFTDAVKEIADILGIDPTPYFQKKALDPRDEQARKMLKIATQIYRKIAVQALQIARSPFATFVQDRKINTNSHEQFQLGMAPGNNVLTKYLYSLSDESVRQQAILLAVELGLIKPNQRPNPELGHYDTFRNRVMFPICDSSGATIGFTSRALLPDQKPKYLNSPESRVFSKKNILYGLHLAKNSIRERDSVVLVEGNMDALMLHQFGFSNAVAIMGVALGTNTMARLKSLTHNFYIAFDSDAAGIMAAQRANADLLKESILAHFLDFSPHKDPDEYLLKEGPVAFGNLLQASQLLVDRLLDNLIPPTLPTLIDQRLDLLRKAMQILSPLGQKLEATERLAIMAQRLGLKSSSEQIHEIYLDFLKGIRQLPARPFKQETAPIAALEVETEQESKQLAVLNDAIVAPKQVPIPLSVVLKSVLKEILRSPQCLELKEVEDILDLITVDEVKRLVICLRTLHFEGTSADYHQLIKSTLEKENFSGELKAALGPILYTYDRPFEIKPEQARRLLRDMGYNLRIEQLRLKKEELVSRQAQAQDQRQLDAILTELTELHKKLHILKREHIGNRPREL